MTKGKHVERTWLQALKEARLSGQDDYDAADTAQQVTLDKHGKLPKEGKLK